MRDSSNTKHVSNAILHNSVVNQQNNKERTSRDREREREIRPGKLEASWFGTLLDEDNIGCGSVDHGNTWAARARSDQLGGWGWGVKFHAKPCQASSPLSVHLTFIVRSTSIRPYVLQMNSKKITYYVVFLPPLIHFSQTLTLHVREHCLLRPTLQFLSAL